MMVIHFRCHVTTSILSGDLEAGSAKIPSSNNLLKLILWICNLSTKNYCSMYFNKFNDYYKLVSITLQYLIFLILEWNKFHIPEWKTRFRVRSFLSLSHHPKPNIDEVMISRKIFPFFGLLCFSLIRFILFIGKG